MTSKDIIDKLKVILKTDMGLNLEITEKTDLINDCGFDSMDFMNYITQVETKFNIKIPDEDIRKHRLEIIENLVKYLSD